MNPGTVPRIGPGFRLQWEPAQDCHVLLYPEGMVKLNQSAGQILSRCDGQRDVAAIVADPGKPLSGLSVLAMRGGEVVYEGQFGRARIATNGAGAWSTGVSGAMTAYVTWLAWTLCRDIHITRSDWFFLWAALASFTALAVLGNLFLVAAFVVLLMHVLRPMYAAVRMFTRCCRESASTSWKLRVMMSRRRSFTVSSDQK